MSYRTFSYINVCFYTGLREYMNVGLHTHMHADGFFQRKNMFSRLSKADFHYFVELYFHTIVFVCVVLPLAVC